MTAAELSLKGRRMLAKRASIAGKRARIAKYGPHGTVPLMNAARLRKRERLVAGLPAELTAAERVGRTPSST